MNKQNKLEEDYKKINLLIERMKKDQINIIRNESLALKEKIASISESVGSSK